MALKGVVLAGGMGSRLFPLTKVTNKHLLPIYDEPMVYYPIRALVEAGIRDIMVVTGGESAGDFLKLLGNGKAFGLDHLEYGYQEGAGGIAEALGLTRYFVGSDPMVVVLGDNILEKPIDGAVRRFRNQGGGARILLKRVPDPGRFGVADLREGRVVGIEEKPKNPRSDLAVIGVYMYDNSVYEIVDGLDRSARGELEITDVNNAYLRRGELHAEEIEGWWTDAGTFESLWHAAQLVHAQKTRKAGGKEG
ncbi:MAG: Glucose-1-phosphate thymidylyltransferase [Planctomycetes bacterium]|nr:Glucose-1-phosphate thymidylyltransferase [Planctomycetota bacterium]